MTVLNVLATGIPYNNFSVYPSGDTYAAIDDPVGNPDDDTTYIYTSDQYSIQRFTFNAISITPTSINSVKIFYRAKKTSANETTLKGVLYVEGTDYYETNPVTLTTDYQDFTTTEWLTNPKSGVAWTEEDIEASGGTNRLTRFGLYKPSGNEMRCTQIYMIVNYETASVTSVALSGTATNSITETDIVNGSKTVILTLTGDTWIA